MTPKKHTNTFQPPTQCRDHPQICLCLCVFLHEKVARGPSLSGGPGLAWEYPRAGSPLELGPLASDLRSPLLRPPDQSTKYFSSSLTLLSQSSRRYRRMVQEAPNKDHSSKAFVPQLSQLAHTWKGSKRIPTKGIGKKVRRKS